MLNRIFLHIYNQLNHVKSPFWLAGSCLFSSSIAMPGFRIETAVKPCPTSRPTHPPAPSVTWFVDDMDTLYETDIASENGHRNG